MLFLFSFFYECCVYSVMFLISVAKGLHLRLASFQMKKILRVTQVC